MLAGALGAAREQEQDEGTKLRVSRLMPICMIEKEVAPKEELVVAVAAPCGHEVQQLGAELTTGEVDSQTGALEIGNEEVELWNFGPQIIEACRGWRNERLGRGTRLFTGTVFSDGSVVDPNLSTLTRTGSAAIQLVGGTSWEDILAFNERSQSCPLVSKELHVACQATDSRAATRSSTPLSRSSLQQTRPYASTLITNWPWMDSSTAGVGARRLIRCRLVDGSAFGTK